MTTATKDPRVRIVNHGPKNWRTEAKDDCGEWAITGPAYATKLEALSNVDHVLHYFHGLDA